MKELSVSEQLSEWAVGEGKRITDRFAQEANTEWSKHPEWNSTAFPAFFNIYVAMSWREFYSWN